MIIFHEVRALRAHLEKQRKKGSDIGFVPTMGALHAGHLSLVRQSMAATQVTLCSIFVNPTQFNDKMDFDKYPVTIEQDIRLLEQAGTDILFLPSVDEVYPKGTGSVHEYELGYLETILEGTHRPGHFQGVCQVVHRLLDIVQPDIMFLGQKDYQQCMVLKKLSATLEKPVAIRIGETFREENGLAMSSRNLRLSPEQREKARALYQTLVHIKKNISSKTIGQLQDEAIAYILDHGFVKVDYVAIANADTLLLLNEEEKWDGQTPVVALVAAFMGEVRLIDNMLLN